MRQEIPKTSYQLLGITPEATDQEIEEAFKKAKAVYAPDSLATYSLYSLKEKENLLKEIVEAYETLKNPEKRKPYDKQQAQSPQVPYRDPLDINDDGPMPMNEDQNNQETFEITRTIKEPKSHIKFKQPLPVMHDKFPMIPEPYRVLYTKLEEISLRQSCNTYAITSAIPTEGKTVTSLNLSYIMAQEFNKKVILVEFDLKRPSLLSYFMNPGDGCDLVEVIKGERDIHEAIMKLQDSNLHFLAVRSSVKNSSELLSFARTQQVLKTLKTEFDYVIIDCPPILPLADMNIISKLVDGLILVVRAGKAPKDIILKASKSLPGKNIVGLVLNGANISYKNYYYYSE